MCVDSFLCMHCLFFTYIDVCDEDDCGVAALFCKGCAKELNPPPCIVCFVNVVTRVEVFVVTFLEFWPSRV